MSSSHVSPADRDENAKRAVHKVREANFRQAVGDIEILSLDKRDARLVLSAGARYFPICGLRFLNNLLDDLAFAAVTFLSRVSFLSLRIRFERVYGLHPFGVVPSEKLDARPVGFEFDACFFHRKKAARSPEAEDRTHDRNDDENYVVEFLKMGFVFSSACHVASGAHIRTQ